eukprot:1142011-Pelagomonas_calceolata.AAC.1
MHSVLTPTLSTLSSCSHGCVSISAAVARFSGTNSSIGNRNSVSASASSRGSRYLSMSTRSKGQKRRRLMWRSSPLRRKYSRE